MKKKTAIEFVHNIGKSAKRAGQIIKAEGVTGINIRLKDILDGAGYSYDGSIDENYLNLVTNRIYDLPDVVIDSSRKKTINVLIPAFNFSSISAGFFGVFAAALFIKRQGYNVRLVLFDNMPFDYKIAQKKLQGYPGFETLFSECEVEYIGERKRPLLVSKNDTALATVWYSAYFAEKIQKTCDGEPFLYLIQDYESNFHPGNALSMLADESYKMNYHALFSTKLLQDYFVKNVWSQGDRKHEYIFYDNCCSCSLPTFTDFKNRFNNSHRRKFVFYCRPAVNRNAFELGALVIIEAIKQGVFKVDDWDFYGIGLGSVALKIAEDRYLYQMERMNLKEYIDSISGYDVGLTLMASPHPSLLPFDLAGSGCIVVTNNYCNKNQEYFSSVSKNIISKEPQLQDLVDGIKEAVSRVSDLDTRYKNAKEMNFPRTWDETWLDSHKQWLDSVIIRMKEENIK